jgi:hypothetical protein
MGSTISIICCARVDGPLCCHVEEEEPDEPQPSPLQSFRTLLVDT